MDPPMELISFVTRSENRVDALVSLASSPQTRQHLQSETGIPRATLSRILADFRDRSLVLRDGHRYHITPLGNVVATELASLVEAVESVRAVQTLEGSLPLDEIGVDFDRLAQADVTLPTPIDPLAPVKRAAAVVEGAAHVRTFCYSVVHAPILAALRGIATQGLRIEGVVAAGVLEVVREDPKLAESASKLFENENVDLYVYDQSIEPQLVIADRTTMFLVTEAEGAIQGLVESDDNELLGWAEQRFASLREGANPISPEHAAQLLTS